MNNIIKIIRTLDQNIPEAVQNSWTLFKALIQAAVLKSTFLSREVAMTQFAAEDITSSKPAYTISLSLAPYKS